MVDFESGGLRLGLGRIVDGDDPDEGGSMDEVSLVAKSFCSSLVPPLLWTVYEIHLRTKVCLSSFCSESTYLFTFFSLQRHSSVLSTLLLFVI